MRTGTKAIALGLGLLVGAAMLRASFADDDADAAFDTTEVKDIAAKVDSMKIDDHVALLARVRKSLDRKLLVPSQDAWGRHENLRGRTDAGLARILQRGRFEGIVTPRGGGAYWSFTKRSNDYDKSPQLELQNGTFQSGFYGGNSESAIVVRVGDGDFGAIDPASVPSELTAPAESIQNPARHAKTPEERLAVERNRKAEVGGVYAVRAVLWDDCDVLAAFEVVSMDAYGATIAWRVLKVYEVPKRPDRPAGPGEGGRGGGGRR